MFKFALLEDFRCPLCEDFGIVEVLVEPPFGLAYEGREPRTQWRACQCRKAETLAEPGGIPTKWH